MSQGLVSRYVADQISFFQFLEQEKVTRELDLKSTVGVTIRLPSQAYNHAIDKHNKEPRFVISNYK